MPSDLEVPWGDLFRNQETALETHNQEVGKIGQVLEGQFGSEHVQGAGAQGAGALALEWDEFHRMEIGGAKEVTLTSREGQVEQAL